MAVRRQLCCNQENLIKLDRDYLAKLFYVRYQNTVLNYIAIFYYLIFFEEKSSSFIRAKVSLSVLIHYLN
jgi:hypothetical protein